MPVIKDIPLIIDQGERFSPCRTWRYSLCRTWDKSAGQVAFIGLNPSYFIHSKKDELVVTKCISYARLWGYGGMIMLNLFAYRAMAVRTMEEANNPIGLHNNHTLKSHHDRADITVACWGNNGSFMDRGRMVSKLLKPLMCFGVTKAGHPMSPICMERCLEPVQFNGYE